MLHGNGDHDLYVLCNCDAQLDSTNTQLGTNSREPHRAVRVTARIGSPSGLKNLPKLPLVPPGQEGDRGRHQKRGSFRHT